MNVMRTTILSFVAAALLASAVPLTSFGAPQEQSAGSQQPPAVQDPIAELNLSPEQREQIRAIRQQLQAERLVVNQRLRETNEALEEALDADNPVESVIEERLRDVAAAQSAAMRIRLLSEVRIRRVLTADQLATLKALRQRARLIRRERQRDNMQLRRQQRVDRQRGLSNRRNALRPLLPRRAERQQQKALP
jgi:Spy/CpxP family protein refolding chaperone